MNLFLLLVTLFSLCLPASAFAQRINQSVTAQTAAKPDNSEHIAAVVNDNIISTADVRARTSMALLTSSLPDNTDIRTKLLPQVLRGLIDEQLELQEGKRMDITISADEINLAMKRLAQQNNIPGGDIAAYLKSHNVPPETLINQIKSTLTWNKVIQRELRPKVDVGDDEISTTIERIKSNAGKQEYLVSEIFLSVDSPKDEEQVKKFAENLVEQIKAGANFGAVARQFSQGNGAANGGDIGWVQEGQLSSDLNKVLVGMHANQIMGPVRTVNGYHIIGVREQRTVASNSQEMSVDLQQMFTPFVAGQKKEALVKQVDALRQSINGCSGVSQLVSQKFPQWHWQDLGKVKLAGAPSWLVERARDLPIGQPSEAMATEKGVLVLLVCGRDAGSSSISREEVLSQIGTERLELLARRLQRDLRRSAYIDVRLNLAN